MIIIFLSRSGIRPHRSPLLTAYFYSIIDSSPALHSDPIANYNRIANGLRSPTVY